MAPNVNKNPKVLCFSVNIRCRDPVNDTTVNALQQWCMSNTFQHFLICENDPIRHVHAFLMVKEKTTQSNFARKIRKYLVPIMEESGADFDPQLPHIAINCKMVYDENWIEEYMVKEDGYELISKHLGDKKDRLEAYALAPKPRAQMEYNSALRRLSELFSEKFPEIAHATYYEVEDFLWAEMREHRMQVQANSSKMARFTRMLRGVINQAETYDHAALLPRELPEK